MKLTAMIGILIVIAMPWLVNAYKVSNCDFESNYKCELIHGAGVIVPPLSFITVWFDSDK